MSIQRRVLDSGIFQIEEISPGDNVAEFILEMVRMVREVNEVDLLETARRDAAEALASAGIPTYPPTSCDVWEPHLNDAMEIVSLHRALEQTMTEEPDLGRALAIAYLIGLYHQRMSVRPFERFARWGKSQEQGRQRGGKNRALRSRPSAAEVDAWRLAVAKRRQSSRMSETEARRRVAEDHGVTFARLNHALGPSLKRK